MSEYFLNIDYWLMNQINSVFTHPLMDAFFFWITDLHKTPYFNLIALPLVAFLFINRFRRQGITLGLILLLSLGVSDFVGGKIKKTVRRERPEHNESIKAVKRSDAGSFSFYSNHASNMFTFATYTGIFVPPLRLPLIALAGLVAYSRVYNGVHYPSDVIVGGAMGALWGFLFAILASRLMLYLKNRKLSP